MPQVDDLSRSLVAFDQDATLIVVVEMSEASWLVAGMAPGVDRQPLKKTWTRSGCAAATGGALA
jgi:transposase